MINSKIHSILLVLLLMLPLTYTAITLFNDDVYELSENMDEEDSDERETEDKELDDIQYVLVEQVKIVSAEFKNTCFQSINEKIIHLSIDVPMQPPESV